jgi:hypothetical protein
MAPGAFGPFRPDIPELERLRVLEVGVAVHCGSDQPAIDALRRAEMDASMSDQALAASYALPALRRRKILATYAAVMPPSRQRGGG